MIDKVSFTSFLAIYAISNKLILEEVGGGSEIAKSSKGPVFDLTLRRTYETNKQSYSIELTDML